MSAILNKLKELPSQLSSPKTPLQVVPGGNPSPRRPSNNRVKVIGSLIGIALCFAGYQQYNLRHKPEELKAAPQLADVNPLIQQANWEDAAKFLETWVKDHPEDVTGLINYGLVLKEKKDYSAAEIQLNKALELQAGSAVAHNNLGVVYGAMGRWKSAVLELETAISLNSQYPDPLFNLATVYEKSGKLPQAIQYYRDYSRRLPPESDVKKALQVRVRKLHALSVYAGGKQ